MSDEFNIKPVTPLPNVNRLAPADRDRGKGSKKFYENDNDAGADEHSQKNEQDSDADESTNEPINDFSDGHSIDIKA